MKSIALATMLMCGIFLLPHVYAQVEVKQKHNQRTTDNGKNRKTSTSPPSTDNSGELAKAKGCIGNDQIAGKTYIDVRCLQDPQLNQVMCDNWPRPGQ
jgi:hypothetical protein